MSLVLRTVHVQLHRVLRREGGPRTLSSASGWVLLLANVMPSVWQWAPHVFQQVGRPCMAMPDEGRC